MKRKDDHYYPGCESLADIRAEKTRLMLKGRILETRMSLDLAEVRESFSLSSLLASVARLIIPGDISSILNKFTN